MDEPQAFRMRREPVFNIQPSVMFLAVLCIVVHLLRQFLPPFADNSLVEFLAFFPARYGGADQEAMLARGLLPAFTSFITYAFVHGDWVHLGVNLVWLFAFGAAVAKRIGDARFLLFSACCAVAGILTHLIFHWGELVPVVGASAAISGQMAAAMLFFFGAVGSGRLADFRYAPRSIPLIKVSEALTNPKILGFLAIWVGLNVLVGLGALDIGASSAIAWEAHIGGFLFGLLSFKYFDSRNSINFPSG